MIWDTFVVKIRLMNLFLFHKLLESLQWKFQLFSIIKDFTFNAFLFGDDTISKISDGENWIF